MIKSIKNNRMNVRGFKNRFAPTDMTKSIKNNRGLTNINNDQTLDNVFLIMTQTLIRPNNNESMIII